MHTSLDTYLHTYVPCHDGFRKCKRNHMHQTSESDPPKGLDRILTCEFNLASIEAFTSMGKDAYIYCIYIYIYISLSMYLYASICMHAFTMTMHMLHYDYAYVCATCLCTPLMIKYDRCRTCQVPTHHENQVEKA